MIGFYTHPSSLNHLTGPRHPESPKRLRFALAALDIPRFAGIKRIQAPAANDEQLLRVHTRKHLEQMAAIHPSDGFHYIDDDTVMSADSFVAARHAAGASIQAVDDIMAGTIQRAFCAVRPPGHHAEPRHAMGFCLFNNIAIAAQHALQVHRLSRVAIADFDVHHGNGTQKAFIDEARVMYASSHQSPFFPGTGDHEEHGCGNIFNEPLPPGTKSERFRSVWEKQLLPHLDAFKPQLLLISAGFDGHRLDPMADWLLNTEDFAWITAQLVHIANQHAEGRIVSCLEGGYNSDALYAGVITHIDHLMQGSD